MCRVRTSFILPKTNLKEKIDIKLSNNNYITVKRYPDIKHKIKHKNQEISTNTNIENILAIYKE
jgi:hypothetical protein